MTDRFVSSVSGADGNDGLSWATAKATLVNCLTGDSAGDVIYVAQDHVESLATTFNLNGSATTAALPGRTICVDRTGSPNPPTALADTAEFRLTGVATMTVVVNSSAIGLRFRAGYGVTGASYMIISNGNYSQEFINCQFRLESSAAAYIQIVSSTSDTRSFNRFINCWFGFTGNTGHYLFISNNTALFSGGGILSSAGSITTLIGNLGNVNEVVFDGFDMTNLSSSANLVAPSSSSIGRIIFNRCKLPASWSGALISSAISTYANQSIEMYNCDNANTNYRLWIEKGPGTIRSETTLVRSGGASDGTTPISWKMTGNSNTAPRTMGALSAPPIQVWVDGSGASRTLTIELLHDSVGSGTASRLRSNEIFMEVLYLGTSGYPLASYVACGDVLPNSVSDYADSSVTWTTTGMTTPLKQKMSVTFTPQVAGYVTVQVWLGKNAIVYVDPKATVT